MDAVACAASSMAAGGGRCKEVPPVPCNNEVAVVVCAPAAVEGVAPASGFVARWCWRRGRDLLPALVQQRRGRAER